MPSKISSQSAFNLLPSPPSGIHQVNIRYWPSVDHQEISQVVLAHFLPSMALIVVHLANSEHIPLSKYIVYADYIREQVEAFFEKNKITPDNMLAIHLRNGVDFVSSHLLTPTIFDDISI